MSDLYINDAEKILSKRYLKRRDDWMKNCLEEWKSGCGFSFAEGG